MTYNGRESTLSAHIHGLLGNYALSHLTTDHIAFTYEAVGKVGLNIYVDLISLTVHRFCQDVFTKFLRTTLPLSYRSPPSASSYQADSSFQSFKTIKKD